MITLFSPSKNKACCYCCTEPGKDDISCIVRVENFGLYFGYVTGQDNQPESLDTQ